MNKFIAFLTLTMVPLGLFSQINAVGNIQPDSITYPNIYAKKLSSDSLSSTFAIWVKLKVRMHKHVNHTEHVLVLEGSGDFTIGEESKSIVKGDLITIPKDTWHGVTVTSEVPLKVISVQSPEFKGKDRIFKNGE